MPSLSSPAPQDFLEQLTPDLALHYQGILRLQQQTRFQQLDVIDTPTLGTLFRLDGSIMTTQAEEWIYHENLVHPAALALPCLRSALIIGGGDGGSARQLLRYPHLQQLVICELDAAVVDMARRLLEPVHQGALNDPRVQLVIGDGADYVRHCQGQFDLIVLDLTDPVGPAAPLYEAPCLQHYARLLGDHGILSLHLTSPQWQPRSYVRLLQALHPVFACVRPALIPVTSYGGLWGLAFASQRSDPASLSAEQADLQLALRDISDLQWYNGDTHQALFALPNFVRQLARAANHQTDAP